MSSLKDSIIPGGQSIAGEVSTDAKGGIDLLNQILVYIKDSIFGLLALITVGIFIYIGWKLIKADGNPEEMKKAFKSLINVVIGLFVVAISFAIVKIVSGLSF